MKRVLKILAFVIGMPLTLILMGAVTGTLYFYKVTTSANLPTIEVGDRLLGTPWMKPGRLDFLCLKADLPYMSKATLAYRLVALGGDTVQIRDGVTFVNGKNIDTALDLTYEYSVSIEQANALEEKGEVSLDHAFADTAGNVVISAPASQMKKLKLDVPFFVIPATQADENIFKVFHQRWNQDHFGPVVVPSGKYFVLGDYRHQAMDSRYIGFIDPSQFVATVLNR